MVADGAAELDGFGRRLREALGGTDLSQSDLARRVGVTRGRVNQWLSGNGTPRRAVALKVAQALGVRVEWLLDEAGPQKAQGRTLTADGVRIDPKDLGPELSRPLLAAMEGRNAEVWKLSTDLLSGANYQPGDYIIIDLAQPAKARDFVLAEVNRTPIFRMFLPPYLFAVAAPGLVNPPPLTVDNLSVIVRGVVVSRFNIS